MEVLDVDVIGITIGVGVFFMAVWWKLYKIYIKLEEIQGLVQRCREPA